MSEPERMAIPDGYSLELVLEAKSEALVEEVVAFWLAHGALPTAQTGRQRAAELACVARGPDGRLAAVSTVYRQKHPRFGVSFHYFRCFVAPEQRRLHLASLLCIEVSRHLEARFKAGHDPEVLGVFMEVQHAALRDGFNRAVWPYVPFVYAGKNAQGDHERVFFFDGAHL